MRIARHNVTTKSRWSFRGSGLKAELLRGGLGSVAVKVGYAALSFTLAVVLARVLGPKEYGVYAFALAIIMLVSIPAQAGMPVLVVRETARCQSNGDWALVRGLWRWATVWVLLFSMVVTVILGAVIIALVGLDKARAATLASGFLLVPMIALGNIRGAALRGLRRVVLGQIPESIVRPTLLILAVLSVVLFGGGADVVTPQRVMALYVVVALASFVLGAWLLFRNQPAEIRTSSTPIYERNRWRKTLIPLALISGLQVINQQIDVAILAIFHDDEEVGVYRAVFQLALLVVFGLQAMNIPLQPHFARLYEKRDMVRLQRLVTITARLILTFALPAVVMLMAFGSQVLSLVFGEGYKVGAIALGILATGQLVNAAMGSVGVLLNMTGHEKDAMRGVAISAVANVLLNFLLIPTFGMAGAAASTAMTLTIWNLLLRRSVKQRLGVETLAFNISKEKQANSQ